MGYGWLEMAGLPEVDWGTFTWPLMAFLWAAGFLYSNRATREDRAATPALGARLVAGRVGGASEGFAADGERNLDGKNDPSLPLAFRIARLFRKRIEEIFEPDGD